MPSEPTVTITFTVEEATAVSAVMQTQGRAHTLQAFENAMEFFITITPHPLMKETKRRIINNLVQNPGATASQKLTDALDELSVASPGPSRFVLS